VDKERTEMREILKSLQREKARRDVFDTELRSSVLLARREENALRENIISLEKQICELTVNLGRSEAEKTYLAQAVTPFFDEGKVLCSLVTFPGSSHAYPSYGIGCRG
jgi:hypothetical protein